MKRNKHSLSYYKLLTCDMGHLVPIACFEVLPGDSIQQSSSALIRVSPLVAPVMHPVTVRIHHWFVPHRLVWDGWEEFITGGADGLGGSSGAFPTTPIGSPGVSKGTLSDYLGVPPGAFPLDVSALPYRSYHLIWNEFYRDADLQSPMPINTGSGSDGTSYGNIQSISWEKDRFTSARPWPQKGPDVSLPLGIDAPVVSDGQELRFQMGAASPVGILAQGGTAAANWSGGPGNTSHAKFANAGLKADLTNASAVNVNDVRRAFALQRYQEARALYGSRYTEYLRYLGVRSSDARLQRPEYLGGGKQTISFTEVLQTGPDTDDSGVASLKGHGIAAMRSRRYRRFFEEHGLVLSLMSVRPRTMYSDGLARMWNRRAKEDYWQKELEHIGQEEVFNKEIYAKHVAPDGVFGYNDRYSDYRHLQSRISGDFHDTLNFWHMGRIFATPPALNSDFVKCDPTKRIHAVQTDQVLWCMVSNNIQARRMVSRGGMPGRIV